MKYLTLYIPGATGLTNENIKFRKPPYGTTEVLNIAVTEYGDQGNYVCGPFTDYQDVKLFIDGVEQTWMGITESGDVANAFLALDGTSTVTADIPMNSHKLTGLATPTADADAATRAWVISQVNSVAKYSDSVMLTRLTPGESELGGNCFASWNDAMSNASGIAATFPSAQAVIEIESAGVDGVVIAVTTTSISPFNDRVNIKSKSQYVRLQIADGASHAVTADTVIIENCTIYLGSGTASMDGFIFKDCIFRISPQSATFTLANCKFRGNNIILNTGAIVLNNCKGIPPYVKTESKCTISGTNLINVEYDPNID